MTKKDPVLWVVVDRFSTPLLSVWRSKELATIDARNRSCFPSFAPFRVVKYLPAPKKRKKA